MVLATASSDFRFRYFNIIIPNHINLSELTYCNVLIPMLSLARKEFTW